MQIVSGQAALVTGASGLVGAEASRARARPGVGIAAYGRAQSALDGLGAEVRGSEAYVGDAYDPKRLAAAPADAEQSLGSIEILVTLAGGDGAPSLHASLGADRWRRAIDTDLNSVIFMVRAVLPGVIERGRGRGRIVTVVSSAGRRSSQASAAYAAAKAGVVMLTEYIAKEYAHAGVHVNRVAPSNAETSRPRDRVSAPHRDAIAANVPLGRIGRIGRIGQPTDTAEEIAFLISDRSSWITSTTRDITGGMIL